MWLAGRPLPPASRGLRAAACGLRARVGPRTTHLTPPHNRAVPRRADWTENDADVATECFECVENANVSEPWGCTNCFSLESKDTFDTFSREECVACVTANPYEDKVGTYNWACGECAAIGSAMIRELCQQCINMPALDSLAAGTLADDLLSVAWVGNATEIICSCVDMVKDSTWGENAPGLLSDWYSFECPNCTAIQKMCYMRRKWVVDALVWKCVRGARDVRGGQGACAGGKRRAREARGL
eukprot:356533-Chlamydomonas_euryale.AAC.1